VLIGFALQTIGLAQRGRAVGGCPIGNTFEVFQFTAWSAIVLYLLIGPTFRLSLLGFFTSGLAALQTLLSLGTPAWDAVRRVGAFRGSPWIEFHAALALFSYGVFALLALTSLMYLLQTYSLRRKHLHGLFSFLPPVLALDHISLRLLVAGVALLTAALAVGSVYWVRDLASVNPAKLIATCALWAAYLVALILRSRRRLISNRLAWVCVVLFAAALASLGPVNASRHERPADAPALRR
jgi:ABC-type uncharacterized transport system permease subunit